MFKESVAIETRTFFAYDSQYTVYNLLPGNEYEFSVASFNSSAYIASEYGSVSTFYTSEYNNYNLLATISKTVLVAQIYKNKLFIYRR